MDEKGAEVEQMICAQCGEVFDVQRARSELMPNEEENAAMDHAMRKILAENDTLRTELQQAREENEEAEKLIQQHYARAIKAEQQLAQSQATKDAALYNWKVVLDERDALQRRLDEANKLIDRMVNVREFPDGLTRDLATYRKAAEVVKDERSG